MITIYVALFENGFQVAFRPVVAEPVGPGLFRISGTVPEDEKWAFNPGEVVRCLDQVFPGGDRVLVASEKARTY